MRFARRRYKEELAHAKRRAHRRAVRAERFTAQFGIDLAVSDACWQFFVVRELERALIARLIAFRIGVLVF